MSQRKNPPRGASRPTRPASKAQGSGRGSSSRGPSAKPRTAGKTAPKAGRRIRKGRLILAVLLLAGLITLLWFVTHRQGPEAATVPPALAKDASQPAEQAQTRSAERFAFYDLLPRQRVLPERDVATRPAPRPRPAQSGDDGMMAPREMLWLQVGEFPDAAAAEARRSDVRALDLPVRLVEGGRPGQHRVLTGPFASESQRSKARETLADAGLDATPAAAPRNPQP